MRERMPGVWEIVVQAGRDPITGKHRQISRTFRGSLREAKKARAELIVEVGKGRHTGSRATLDDLFGEWIIESRC
jgi:integrase